MRALLLLGLLACEHPVPDPSPPPSPRPPPPTFPDEPKQAARPLFRWDFVKIEDNRIGAHTGSWLDGDNHVVWTKPLTGRVGTLSLCCWDLHTETYLVNPRTSDYAGLDLEPTSVGDAIVLEQYSALLVLAKADGHTIFEWADPAYPRHELDGLVMDDGDVTIAVGGQTCKVPVGASHWTAACGDTLVYYDDDTLAAFSLSPWKLVEARHVNGTRQDCSRPVITVDRHEKIGTATVHFHGTRRTMCMH